MPPITLEATDAVLQDHEITLGLRWLKEMEESHSMTVSFGKGTATWRTEGHEPITVSGELAGCNEGRLAQAIANGVTVVTKQDDIPDEL